MRLKTDWRALRERIREAVHLLEPEGAPGAAESEGADDPREWVIVYRTAHGFCCVYRGEPVEFAEMLDVQVWSEDEDVRTWFIGL